MVIYIDKDEYRRKRSRRYYEQNKEKLIAYQKEYYEQNKEKRKAYRKEYYARLKK